MQVNSRNVPLNRPAQPGNASAKKAENQPKPQPTPKALAKPHAQQAAKTPANATKPKSTSGTGHSAAPLLQKDLSQNLPKSQPNTSSTGHSATAPQQQKDGAAAGLPQSQPANTTANPFKKIPLEGQASSPQPAGGNTGNKPGSQPADAAGSTTPPAGAGNPGNTPQNQPKPEGAGNPGAAAASTAQEQTVQDGVIGNFQQAADKANCNFLSSLGALSQTPQGQASIQQMITPQGNDAWNVTFPGAPNEQIQVTRQDLQSNPTANGDLDAQILANAADKHFNHQQQYAIDHMKLLTGPNAQVSLHGGQDAGQIKDFLTQEAPRLASGDAALTASGTMQPDGSVDWSYPTHQLYLNNIDPQNNTVSYKNPWDSSQVETTSLDALSQQLAQGGYETQLTSADF